ncbi:MAG: glycosyltransferase family 4 protein [Patescibacteria group bacterium]
MAKKKLLFVITKAVWGGAGVYVYDLATSLKDEYDVAVALGGEGRLLTRLRAAGIRTIPVPSMARDIEAGLDAAAFFELRGIFKKERPDIVHLNSSKAGGLGALAARTTGVRRIVFTVHGWAYNEPVSALAKLFRWGASLATLILCHKGITVSHFDNQHSPLGIPVTTIHNGIPPTGFVPHDEARARITGMAPEIKDEPIIGTIAELHRNKGIDVLVGALTSVPKGHVVVMGTGEEQASLTTLIRKHHLEERFHLLGFVENAATLLKGFDIFVLPSRKEGLPYTILEAGAAGVPVISTTVGGIPEIIDDNISGTLVNAFDAHELADALNEMIESPNTRERFGEALRAKVERDFSLPGMIRKTVQVYES